MKLNTFLDYYGLKLLRVVNAIIFIALVLYIGKWITGIDIGKIITTVGLLFVAHSDSEMNIMMVVIKKIKTFGWGLSFITFNLFLMVLWNMRGAYIDNINQNLSRFHTKSQ